MNLFQIVMWSTCSFGILFHILWFRSRPLHEMKCNIFFFIISLVMWDFAQRWTMILLQNSVRLEKHKVATRTSWMTTTTTKSKRSWRFFLPSGDTFKKKSELCKSSIFINIYMIWTKFTNCEKKKDTTTNRM